ncbi:MAG: hypothetical protein R2727_10340 [Bacteroidales bacterium]
MAFSPMYPHDIISQKDITKNSQVHFYAVDMNKREINLLERGENAGLVKLDMMEAEKHGSIKHSASVYNQIMIQLRPDSIPMAQG